MTRLEYIGAVPARFAEIGYLCPGDVLEVPDNMASMYINGGFTPTDKDLSRSPDPRRVVVAADRDLKSPTADRIISARPDPE